MRGKVTMMLAVAVIGLNARLFSQVSPQSPPAANPKKIAVEGQITKVEVTTPHVFLYLSVVTPAKGKPTVWAIQTGSLSELTREGIKGTDLRIGVMVRVEGALMTGENRLEVPVGGISFPN